MKVLYYCPEYYFRHGGRTHARGFFNAIQNLPRVSKAGLYPKKEQIEDKLDAETVSQAGSRDKLWFLPPVLRRIVRFFLPRPSIDRAIIGEIETHNYDVLIVRTGARIPSISNIRKACPELAICLEVNSAYFDEGFQGVPFRKLLQAWEVKRFRDADAITVVSSYLKRYLQERNVVPSKLMVNHNGVTPVDIDQDAGTSIRREYGIPESAFVLGYIGGMERFRRLPQVIAQFAEMRRDGNRGLFLLLVGDGEDMPRVRREIDRNGGVLKNSVRLAGWQDHDRIPAFLSAFDVAIFPYTNDYCSPLKLFEYLGAGIPTLGPDTSAVREVFQDNEHLILVAQDGSDFTKKLLLLMDNEKKRQRIAQSGRDLVLLDYTWERNAIRTMEHISQRARERVA